MKKKIAAFIVLACSLSLFAVSENAMDLWKKGEEARKKGDNATAYRYYYNSLEKEPENGSHAAFLGWFLIEKMNDPGTGLGYLDRAVAAGYSKSFIATSRARALRELKRWEESAAAYEKASADTGNGIEMQVLYLFEAGRMYFQAGRVDRALPLLSAAFKKRKGKYETYITNSYGSIIYDSFSESFSNQQWEKALMWLDILEPFLAEVKPDDTALVQRYHMLFYTVPLRRVVMDLRSMKPAKEVQIIKMLFIYCFDESPSTENIRREIHRAEMNMELLLRHLSCGRLELSIDHVYMPEAQTAASLGKSSAGDESYDGLNVIQPVETGKKLLPLLKGMSSQTKGEYDTIFYFFNGSAYKAARPSAAVLSANNFSADGGFPAGRKMIGFVSIPYDTHRKLEGMYIHEYFHLLENRYGIKVKHGFSPDRIYRENKRTAFPEWKGTGQYDYYYWHFRKTFDPAGYRRALHP